MEKTKNQLQISVSNDGFVDEGDGVVSFPNGLTITDGSIMRSGARYDISSLDIDKYQGQLTADHKDSLGTLIGKTINTTKSGDRVSVQAIKYAIKENPYARLAYDLLVGGFSNSFSIETIGPWPGETDRTYRDHELVGLSQVVVPNNYNAVANQLKEVVHNSLEVSKEAGLDTTDIEDKFYSSLDLISSEAVVESEVEEEQKVPTEEVPEETKNSETPEDAIEDAKVEETEIKTTEDENSDVESEDDSEEETTEEEPEDESTDESGEDESEEVAEDDAANAESEEATETDKSEDDASGEDESEEENKNINEEKIEMTPEQIAEIVENAIKPLADEIAATKEIAQSSLDASAKEPEFKDKAEATNYASVDANELFSKQLNAAIAVERTGNVEARLTLNEINAHNLQALKDEKIVNAALTLEDLGNFVIAPELAREIEGKRTNYSAILDATEWRETNSLEWSWLTRGSDIDMKNVAIGALGDVFSPDYVTEGGAASGQSNKRLKPVSMPSYGPKTEKLEEMAAVTPISVNVAKFAAADILGDIAIGYRNDYDKKRAQLVIARLQQAVDETDQKQIYSISEGIKGWILATSKVSDATNVGTLIFNNRTLSKIKAAAIDEKNTSILTEITSGSLLGTPFLVVPNDLLPTLDSTETRSFEVQGQVVTVDSAVFYADLATFTGRTSGGLKYDVDGSASYEIDGTVYSAYQRNEVVLRGSFFRGGVVKDPTVVASIPALAIS